MECQPNQIESDVKEVKTETNVNTNNSVSETRQENSLTTELSKSSCNEPINNIQTEKKLLTAAEIEEKEKVFLNAFVEKLVSLPKTPIRDDSEVDSPFHVKFRKTIHYIAKSYFSFKEGEVPYHVIAKLREKISQSLVDYSSVTLMCDALSDALAHNDFSNADGTMKPNMWYPVKNIILTLLNYSDCNDKIKQIICDHAQLFPLTIKFLSEKCQKYLNKELTPDFEKMCKWLLSIIHNCGSLKENVSRLRDLNVIQTVLPYLESHVESHKLSVISILGDLVNEEEAELLGAHVSVFKFLLKTLENALGAESHKNLGWSVQELTRAVRQLARNDANKEVLVHEGCLPLIGDILENGNDLEINEAIQCLWILSFDVENKKQIIEDSSLVQKVYKGYQTSEEHLKQAYYGVLWSLREELIKSDKYKLIGEEISKHNVVLAPGTEDASVKFKQSSQKFKGHVMISYQWADQETIKKICSELRAHSVPVWIDIDYMGGSTLQAMAKAVEDACIVIIAMSQLYKDSPNTRAEAEYAFQCRKKIIPLIMQKRYKPDGWLGLILGTKLYYDFSGKYPDFNKPMKGLLQAVLGSKTIDDVDWQSILQPVHKEVILQQQDHTSHPQKISVNLCKNWTPDDVIKWLTKHHLQMSPLQHLSNDEIIFLAELKHEAPEFFYHCLDQKLSLMSLQDLARASQAFQEISS